MPKTWFEFNNPSLQGKHFLCKLKQGFSQTIKKAVVSTKTRSIVLTSLCATLTCILTILLPFPTPLGFIHPGDGMVLLSGLILGPIYGAIASSLGSVLGDALLGYWVYVPATLVIKALCACLCALCAKHLKKNTIGRAMAGTLSMLWMVIGYYFFETLLYGPKGAWLSVPTNLLQGAFGIVFACLLYPVLQKIPYLTKIR